MNRDENRSPQRHRGTEKTISIVVVEGMHKHRTKNLCVPRDTVPAGHISVPLGLMVGMPT